MQLSVITATYQRAMTLQQIALPSISSQSDLEFQWVVVNNGHDPATRSVMAEWMQALPGCIDTTYLEMAHPIDGFGLCDARNLSLAHATGDWILYLDDDNRIKPDCITAVKAFYQQHPDIRYSMVQQYRRLLYQSNLKSLCSKV